MPDENGYGDESEMDHEPEMGGEDEAGKGAEEHKDEGEPSALLPKSILAGKTFNPGDELVLKVEEILEDEVIVSYAKEKPEQKDNPEPTREGVKSKMRSMAGYS